MYIIFNAGVYDDNLFERQSQYYGQELIGTVLGWWISDCSGHMITVTVVYTHYFVDCLA